MNFELCLLSMMMTMGEEFVFLNLLILERFQFWKIKVTLWFHSYIFCCSLANYKIYAEHLPVYVVSGTLPLP